MTARPRLCDECPCWGLAAWARAELQYLDVAGRDVPWSDVQLTSIECRRAVLAQVLRTIEERT